MVFFSPKCEWIKKKGGDIFPWWTAAVWNPRATFSSGRSQTDLDRDSLKTNTSLQAFSDTSRVASIQPIRDGRKKRKVWASRFSTWDLLIFIHSLSLRVYDYLLMIRWVDLLVNSNETCQLVGVANQTSRHERSSTPVAGQGSQELNNNNKLQNNSMVMALVSSDSYRVQQKK